MSSLAAAVQGMDEAVINGAQIIYPAQFGIGSKSREFFIRALIDLVSYKYSEHDTWIVGLINSAPYMCVPIPPRRWHEVLI
jgi:hypothetical protein